LDVESENLQVSSDQAHRVPSTKHSALLLGYGNVNQAVATCLERERDRLAAFGLQVWPVRALVRDLTKRRSGPAMTLRTDHDHLIDRDIDVVVEALGGVEPARSLVASALAAGIPVVSANKTLVAAHGRELRKLAAEHATTFLCDAAVLAGVPFLGSLERRPLVSAARRIEAILNGTSHFVVSAIAGGATFDVALAEAQERGYAEPDSAADVSGRDAAEKLTILLQLAGHDGIAVEHLTRLGIDVLEPEDFAAARRVGGTIKPVALASLASDARGAWVGPAFVDEAHPFARLHGVTNALRLTTATGCCTFSGPGAGPAVTAATIVDDLVELLNAGPRQARVRTVADAASDGSALAQPATSRWFIRVSENSGLDAADVAEYLAARRAPAVRIDEQNGRVVCLTSPAAWSTIADVLAAVRGCGAQAVALPVVEGGDGE
jgi:homoserine dehydrogenase